MQLAQATPFEPGAEAWHDWLLLATKIWKAWTRGERDNVTVAMNKLSCTLGGARSSQDKMKILVSCQDPQSELNKAISAANKRFDHKFARAPRLNLQ